MTSKYIYLLDPRYYEFSLVTDNITKHWFTSRTYITPLVFCFDLDYFFKGESNLDEMPQFIFPTYLFVFIDPIKYNGRVMIKPAVIKMTMQ